MLTKKIKICNDELLVNNMIVEHNKYLHGIVKKNISAKNITCSKVIVEFTEHGFKIVDRNLLKRNIVGILQDKNGKSLKYRDKVIILHDDGTKEESFMTYTSLNYLTAYSKKMTIYDDCSHMIERVE